MSAACGSVASPCMLLWCGAWLTPPPRSVCRLPAALAQNGKHPLHYAVEKQASEAITWYSLLEAYPEAAKEKNEVRVGGVWLGCLALHAAVVRRWLTPPPRSMCRLPAALAQNGKLPLHYALEKRASKAVVDTLLMARYFNLVDMLVAKCHKAEVLPRITAEAAKEKDEVRGGGVWLGCLALHAAVLRRVADPAAALDVSPPCRSRAVREAPAALCR